MIDQTQERELKALISLTDEPDERIFNEITEKIILYGIDAIPLLEESWEKLIRCGRTATYFLTSFIKFNLIQ